MSGPSHAEIAALLMKHRTSLYAYAYCCLRSHHDAEDVLQQASVAAIESSASLTEPSGFLSWAREIVRRRVLEYHRKSGRERPIDPMVAERLVEASDRVEDESPAGPYEDAMRGCLDKLPAATQRLVVAKYSSRTSASDLATRFGRTVQGVYAVIKRAKSMLRDCVERRLAGESTQ